MSYPIRKNARIHLEAESAFAINSGKVGLIRDNEILRDSNGLPYIPGTTLAGILRHLSGNLEETAQVFGSGGKDGEGSKVMISSACIIGEEGLVIEGLQSLPQTDFYSHFQKLPFRDHVAISEKGAAVKGAKFDEEIIFKGTRFVFDLELICNSAKETSWDSLMDTLFDPDFRIGHGTRKGLGQFKILPDSHQVCYNLNLEEDLENYLKKPSSLNGKLPGDRKQINSLENNFDDYQSEKIELIPVNFFLFGAGFGDMDVDHTSKREKIVSWVDGKPKITEKEFIIIPATSIKGALAHRVMYHYNYKTENFIQSSKGSEEKDTSMDIELLLNKLQSLSQETELTEETTDEKFSAMLEVISNFQFDQDETWITYEKNLTNELDHRSRKGKVADQSKKVIRDLFGYAGDQEQEQGQGQRGNVLVEDCYIPYQEDQEKIFNHVKIDRFTGGASSSALFQEKAYYYPKSISLQILVKKSIFDLDPNYSVAWEKAIEELKSGQIPLGGMTTKGHGLFKPLNSQNS
ncbi:RAMP superfamily CRISPR-associated protein [Algoriphagus chordae]|uniref:CRISPR/Cas system CSM-associated protein Csm3 (Group 7 of RAMP superfamily) n=1 Tax=Algoriphagus chordae TaxID=237019 RepID=A0A2W7QI84_9BACT|nr:RAMP superfamily CRISPR-associated protein [Algoriphagus chordae]PZX48288.1 CRISPR/Cas system CSM-associated protein Csm3 (group 7 of RAMP superfamily) [Algoriphagus chordae]